MNTSEPRSTCPICDSPRLRYWGERDGYAHHKCRSCGHVHTAMEKSSLSSMDSNDFRERMSSRNAQPDDHDYYRHLCKAEAPGRHTNRTAAAIFKLAGTSSGKWLDIGCGSGYLVKEAGRLGWNAVGIEPGQWGQIAASEKQIQVVHGFLTENTFQEKFQVISATDVLEHQPDPYSLLKLIRHHLSPDGKAFISVPYVGCLQARVFGTRWAMVMPPNHCQLFSRKSISTMLRKSGFNLAATSRLNCADIPIVERFPLINALAVRCLDRLGLGDQITVMAIPT